MTKIIRLVKTYYYMVLQPMKTMLRKLTMPLLGVLLWVLSIHSGNFINGSLIKPYTVSTETFYPTFTTRTINQQRDSIPMTVKDKDVREAVALAENTVNRMTRLETNLGWANMHVKEGTSAHGQLIENYPANETLEQGRAALIAAKASQNLMKCPRTSTNKCAKYLNNFKLTSTSLKNVCIKIKASCQPRDISSKYRSIDGSCNSELDGNRGKSFTPYKRVLFPAYLDGIQIPRRALSKKKLPSARLVSTRMTKNIDLPDTKLTLAFMQWTQFVMHDMSRTTVSKMLSSKKSIRCCTPSGQTLSPRFVHPLCMPIIIPSDDAFYSKNYSNCMPYTRSMLALRSDCSLGPIDQMNQATHFLDGSHIYGATIRKANTLREFAEGRLTMSIKDGHEYLPHALNAKEFCQRTSDKIGCYRTGDTRVNIYPHLTAMHTFWTREHNRVAHYLENLNPQWDDERLYQEARAIVVAEIQHITYEHWLPLVIGQQNADKINTYNKYKDDVDPSVSNSFATAALKFINSLMQSSLHMYKDDRKSTGSIRLQDHYNYPVVVEKPGFLDGLIRGLATQLGQQMDLAFISDITQQLYRNGNFGMDGLSLDIQRGRDHGLPAYVEYREFCGLSKVNRFEDLNLTIPQHTIMDLRTVYENPRDIDLIVGALAEKPVDNNLLGPTLICLIRDQMYRTRVGDRYFYTNTPQFTADQLKEIKKVTLARIFCDNGDDIFKMQPNVFATISDENKLVNCIDDTIPRINLAVWEDFNLT